MPFANAQGARRLSELRGTAQSNASDLPANPVWHRYVSDHQSTTRALVDGTGSITDTFGYLPYGEVNQTTFQYTGEPQAAGGLTYLRARFVDPRQGRFLGMDQYAGNARVPLGFNRFNYTHSSPVMGVDPSGMFLIDPAFSSGAHAGLQTARAMQAAKIAKVVVATMTIVAAVTITAIQVKNKNKEKNANIKGRVIVFGKDKGEAAKHMSDALDAGMPRILNNREDPHPRDWWKKYGVCLNATRSNGLDCDEYPFARVDQGGEKNWLDGNVSLKALNLSDNRSVGNLLKQFYNDPECKFKDSENHASLKGLYGVIVDLSIEKSFYVCNL
jgi:RHS repeat-associated protein